MGGLQLARMRATNATVRWRVILQSFREFRDRQMTELVNSLQTPSVGFRFRAFRLCAAFRKG